MSRAKQVADALATRERQVEWAQRLLDYTGSVGLARDVVDASTAKDGLDLTTANAILAVAKALSPANAQRFDDMPTVRAAEIAWKLVTKGSS